jgi:hypothetical protein
MNFFNPIELIRFKYKYNNGVAFPYTLYATLGVIKENDFLNRLRRFNKLHKNLLIVEVLENDPEFIRNELLDFKDLSDEEIEKMYVMDESEKQ